MSGNSIIERSNLSSTSLPAKFINSTTLLFGLPNSAVLWNIYTNVTTELHFKGHHDYEYNYANDSYFAIGSSDVEINGTSYVYTIIKEYDQTGRRLWTLDTQSFIDPNQWCPLNDTIGGRRDIVHGNTIFSDPDEDVIYFNARNTNTFYKIDHKTSQIIWALGEYGDFTLFDQYGIERQSLFYHAHAVEKIDDYKFILFDNDKHNQTDPLSTRSRIIELTINESSMTANISWVWSAPQEYYSTVLGDADRLPNHNRFGTFGTSVHPNTSLGARLVEVSESGQIVWEMNYQRNNDCVYAIYQAERFRFNPILSSPPDMPTVEDNVSVSWLAWYNFNSNADFNGNYTLLLDNMIYSEGNFVYRKYWRPSNLSFSFNSLELGNHNLTLSISDEAGHITSDTVWINVTGFYLIRDGPISMEAGHDNSTIRWWGATSSPIFCNITLNESLHYSQMWSGSNILLNTSSLLVGSYRIVLHLYDNDTLVYEDCFLFTVYSRSSPIFIVETTNRTISWNEPLALEWRIFDNSPSSWEIILDGKSTASEEWISPSLIVNWTVPSLNEGMYNVTIIILDDIGYIARNTIWLTILSPSPPVISSTPEQTDILWGRAGVSFAWEIHGGTHWRIRRNGTVISEGIVNGNTLELAIEDWQMDGWRLGIYNLTLSVYDGDASASSYVWIRISIQLSDPYAEAVVDTHSLWSIHRENALGPPDNEYALIFVDYENGYLTLDMGENEDIIDTEGADFELVALGGTYNVYASDSLNVLFKNIGRGSGNQSFDLSNSGIDNARYIRIEYFSGDDVRLDAIIALSYNVTHLDQNAPLITGPMDFWELEDQDPITVLWNASDEHPWNYSVYVNKTAIDLGPWYGADIYFDLNKGIGIWNVTLVVFDLFENHAEDSVLIEVRAATSNFISDNNAMILIAIMIGFISACVIIWRIGYLKSPTSN
jgi:hypothetical protein